MIYPDHEIIQTVRSLFRFNNSCNTDMLFQKQVMIKYTNFFALVWYTNKNIRFSNLIHIYVGHQFILI